MTNIPNLQAEACVPQETMIKDVMLAHAYVPKQKLCGTFTPMRGLKNGTIFPPLTGLYPWSAEPMGDDD